MTGAGSISWSAYGLTEDDLDILPGQLTGGNCHGGEAEVVVGY